jgi:thiopeptide-type bacteriocin biosynthesis protein
LLAASILAPREEHDDVVRAAIAPLIHELAAGDVPPFLWFERFNKPEWGVRLRADGSSSWEETVARPAIERRLTAGGRRFTFTVDEAEDKWLGGAAEAGALSRFHHADAAACLDLMEIETRGALSVSRGQWSLLAVEGMLDRFGIRHGDRLEFYRRGFSWAPELGRWDAEVFAALDRKFDAQATELRRALIVPAEERAAADWGGDEAARVATGLLSALRAPLTEAGLARSAVDVAVFAAHAHSNRLGIHATQEATIRYLTWRAAGGQGPGSP